MYCEFTKEELKLIASACFYIGKLLDQIGIDANVTNNLNFKDSSVVCENLREVEHRRWLLNDKLQKYIAEAEKREIPYTTNKQDFIFKEDRFKFLCEYKGYIILEARLNAHNAEYCIQQLGLKQRWTNIKKCKEYISKVLKERASDSFGPGFDDAKAFGFKD